MSTKDRCRRVGRVDGYTGGGRCCHCFIALLSEKKNWLEDSDYLVLFSRGRRDSRNIPSHCATKEPVPAGLQEGLDLFMLREYDSRLLLFDLFV